MIFLIIIPSIISIFNLYKRLTCKIKVKFTKFTILHLLVVFVFLFYILNILTKTTINYLIFLIWYFSFFTSLIACGITKEGFLYPFYLISKLYKFEKVKIVDFKKNKKTFLITFKAIREIRLEFDIKDLENVKKFLKTKNIKLK